MTAEGLGTQLRRLLELLDGDVDQVYAADGLGYRARYTPVMKALGDGRARSIKDIARQSSLSHSAACQTIEKMVQSGFLERTVGDDARQRLVGLTRAGKEALPLLRKHWAATEAAAARLDEGLEHPLGATIAAAISALEAHSFLDRIKTEEEALNKEKNDDA
jgi:DNA-binding MarR family transcriptional regulator